MNSYIASDIAEFIRQELLTEGLSFSFETVMSDLSKVDFLNLAKKKVIGFTFIIFQLKIH